MKTCFIALVVLAATAHSAHGWWDNEHMVVSKIATQCLAKEDVCYVWQDAVEPRRQLWSAHAHPHHGDMQNPVHSVNGSGPDFPLASGGDVGGNFWNLNSPCPATNLHALWDAVGGKYGSVDWSLNIVEGSSQHKSG
ncbi:Aste57867_2795 [Aphanomyces stellatus]|uniref:Aste57867_2795 protein n=1 Tax=Aphanomyces stellatus TaxID=120398 RepID=A0A485K8D6_9STRA|nr:hypothetical protein As57867_002788 [Aphanomyces stellatus]VFT79985.1 Aste57867_2795 [Aphanomyces stellatus]